MTICAGPCMAQKDGPFQWGMEGGIAGQYCQTCYSRIFEPMTVQGTFGRGMTPSDQSEYAQWLESALLDVLNRPRITPPRPQDYYRRKAEYNAEVQRSVELAERDQDIRDELERRKQASGGADI